MNETCMFCLEEVKSTEVALNPIGCQCHYNSHGSCLQSWFEEKNQYECPICHTIAVLNPFQPTTVQVVYVRERDRLRITEAQQKCILACCVGWIFWSLFVTLLDLYFLK